jgi:hypothetical protein
VPLQSASDIHGGLKPSLLALIIMNQHKHILHVTVILSGFLPPSRMIEKISLRMSGVTPLPGAMRGYASNNR